MCVLGDQAADADIMLSEVDLMVSCATPSFICLRSVTEDARLPLCFAAVMG